MTIYLHFPLTDVVGGYKSRVFVFTSLLIFLYLKLNPLPRRGIGVLSLTGPSATRACCGTAAGVAGRGGAGSGGVAPGACTGVWGPPGTRLSGPPGGHQEAGEVGCCHLPEDLGDESVRGEGVCLEPFNSWSVRLSPWPRGRGPGTQSRGDDG